MQERIGKRIPRKNYWQEIGGRIAKIYSLEDY
jgi:hypothetical protein